MANDIVDPLENLKQLFYTLVTAFVEFFQKFIIVIATVFFVVIALLLLFFKIL